MKGDGTPTKLAVVLKQSASALSLVAASGIVHLSEGGAERGGALFTRIILEQRVDPDNEGENHWQRQDWPVTGASAASMLG